MVYQKFVLIFKKGVSNSKNTENFEKDEICQIMLNTQNLKI